MKLNENVIKFRTQYNLEYIYLHNFFAESTINLGTGRFNIEFFKAHLKVAKAQKDHCHV